MPRCSTGIGYTPGIFWGTLVGCTELIGGILLVVGLFTRFAAAAVLIFMIVAVKFTSAKGFFWTAGGYGISAADRGVRPVLPDPRRRALLARPHDRSGNMIESRGGRSSGERMLCRRHTRPHHLATSCNAELVRQDHEGETMSIAINRIVSSAAVVHGRHLRRLPRTSLLLVGRMLLGWLFLTTAWGKFLEGIDGFAGYLTSLTSLPRVLRLDRRGGGIRGRRHADFRHWRPAMPPCCASCSSSLRPRSHIATGSTRPHKWERKTTNFIKNLAILGGALCLFVTGGAASASIGCCRRSADAIEADRQLHSSLLARRAPCASASSFAHMIEGWTRR